MAEHHEKKRRPRNPFSLESSSYRENFPNLDTFLRISSPLSSEPDKQSLAATPTASFPCDNDDESDGDTSSVLNMSIGARAALSEHLRHIAKHGIDGESSMLQSLEFVGGDTGDRPKSAQDQQWEYFLEHRGLDADDASPDTSFARSSKRSPRCHIFANTSTSLEQSIEVMTDISEDFFDSSRVQELATPERNRARVNFVTTRNESVDEDEDFLTDEQERADTLAPELLLIQASSSSEEFRSGHMHSSFQAASFCAPDISRISSTDDSEPGILLHRSPSSSFQFHLQLEDDPHHFPLAGEAHRSPFFLGGISPLPAVGLDACHQYPLDSSLMSMRSIPASPNSSPLEARARTTHSVLDPSEGGTFLRNHSSISPQRFLSAHDDAGKENCANLSAMHRRKIGTTAEKPSSAFDTLASDLLSVIERDRIVVEDGAAPSPISQVGSSHVDNVLYESSSSSSRRRLIRSGVRLRQHYHGERMVPYPPIASSMQAQDNSTSSSSSSSSLNGRKRYRTVVPRRVYMGSPSQFPDENDSFGNMSGGILLGCGNSSSNASPAHRSLLDSFEAVVEVGDEEEPQISNGCTACYMNNY